MLYDAYQFQDDMIAHFRSAARMAGNQSPWPVFASTKRAFDAGLEMVTRLTLTHTRPEFGITKVRVGNRDVPVSERVVLDLPFGKLLHFVKDSDIPQPKVLVIAPLSGHFATLLAKTCATLLRDHDVYITDWVNARDVPTTAGSFGVDEYCEYVIRFLEEIGPGAHILAVCQPCVQALVAVAVMSDDKHPATPRTMTLMAGPIDPRESPTEVNKLAKDKPLSWFKQMVISRVPAALQRRRAARLSRVSCN